MNYTPVVRHNYRVGIPTGGHWRAIFDSDARQYGGSGQGDLGDVEASVLPQHYWERSLSITLPALGAVMLKPTHSETAVDAATAAI